MDLTSLLLVAPVLLFSMVAHEYAHGYAAFRHGDPTAYQLGRLTWNPVKHIDPFMTVLLPIMTWVGSGGTLLFGGAKPVPVQPRNYRDYKRGDIVVSLAGVATNLVIAVVCTLLVVPLGLLGQAVPGAAMSLSILQQMMLLGIQLNLVLAAFNLLPIPPLDGSHVFKYLLPPAWALKYQEVGRYGLLILILFLTIGRSLLIAWMSPAFTLIRSANRALAPYILPAPWL